MKDKLNHRDIVAVIIFLITTIVIIWYTTINQDIDKSNQVDKNNKYENYGEC
jgi:hypothetical protein